MAPSGRPSFTLPAARALRERVDRVTGHAARRGTPRARYLAQQRAELAARLVPAFALGAVATGAIAASDLIASRIETASRDAIVTEAALASLLAIFALLVPILRRRARGLVSIATGGAVVALFGWAIAIRASGGASSPYLLALPLVLALFAGLVPLPPRAALVAGAAGYGALLAADFRAPFAAQAFVLAASVAAYVGARARHARSLAQFLRVERAHAAVARVRRVQEQLVVVEKLEALRVLVGGMAHELNNALTVASASSRNAAKLVERGDTDGAVAAVQRSEAALLRIQRSVERLRRFAMAAEGTLEAADVGALLDFALESAIGRARSGVVIERAYAADVGPVACHVAALAEALFQIARNAVEAMPGGGRIHASVRREGTDVILAVRDEGRGIPPDELARVFDPFWTRAATVGGTRRSPADRAGLGLSAVYGLVDAMGGSVEVRSTVGEGTEIALRLPARGARET
jgi:signal transduction histidine kinase